MEKETEENIGEGKRGKYLEKGNEENNWRRKERKIFGEGKIGKYLEK